MATSIRNFFTRRTSTTTKMSPPDIVESLFPAPTRFPPSALSPHAIPGTTPEAEQALLETLKHNHQNNHIFFNDKGYHNHAAHHILAIYGLGANGKLLREGYENDKSYQRPLGKSPGPVSDNNFCDHLGDARYYQAYLEFFSDQVIAKGVDKTLEDYLYSKNFNFNDRAEVDGSRQPEMFSRFMSGLMHPLIHVGYGLEFGLAGILVEGLAQSAVHRPNVSALIPRSYFDEAFYSNAVAAVVSGVSTLLHNATPNTFRSVPPQPRDTEVSVFDVLALVLQDDSLAAAPAGGEASDSLASVLRTKGDTIRKYAEMWSLDVVGSPNPDQEINRKIEELAWAVSTIYGVSGWNRGPPFKADFALMHLVTSSLFLPSICAYFPPHVIQLFLRSYFSTCLALWVGLGRPSVEITPEFISTTDACPQEPVEDRVTKPAGGTLTPETVTPNPWLAIIQSALEHPDDHVCKIQRSLGHWGRLFGGRPQGYWAKSSPKEGAIQLKGIELLDGTLFVRIAGMTQAAKGWMREGQEQGGWS